MSTQPALVCAVADVHLGNHKRFGGPVDTSLNRRCWLALDVLRSAAERAIALEARAFVVLGDLFDTDRPEPQLITAVHHVLQRLNRGDVTPVLLLGNHEQTSTITADHALGPLAAYAEIVDSPRVIHVRSKHGGSVALGCIPFRPGSATEWINEAAASLEWEDEKTRVLCIHAGVRDVNTAPWLQESLDAISVDALRGIANACNVQSVLAGNWHDKRIWEGEPAVVQLGALVPTGFDNLGIDGYGTLAIVNAEGDVGCESIPGPRFVKVASDGDLRTALAFAAKRGSALHLSWQVPASMVQSASATLAGMVDSKQIVAGEVTIDASGSTKQAESAAEAARSMCGMDAALDAYVAEMPLPPGVERNEVLERSRRYLG